MEDKKLHFVLLRQLKHAGLSEDDIAADKREHWRDFLMRMSRSLDDYEQEHYLTERSMRISEGEFAEVNEKLTATHQKLLIASRQAGMAQIATTILHNVGNILNSANVSLAMIIEEINKSHSKKLTSVSQLIKEQLQLNKHYLTEDPRGEKIPEFLIVLSETLQEQADKIAKESRHLRTHLQHIQDIVMLQNELSGVSPDVRENIFIKEVIELALQMSDSMSNKKFNITAKYLYDSFIAVDKVKLLQILVNLIQNAKDSLMVSKQTNKIINIVTKKTKHQTVKICIQDNGIGISKEDLTKIFSFGFTTKPKGHGFGLHSCALSARELNGSLSVISEGKDKGARFVLELPLG